MTDTMRRSWLVQRLQKPLTFGLAGLKDNPFAFGGGLKNGGLSDDAMDLLRPTFGLDYMGAAEFEFGAVPKALQGLAQAAGKRGSLAAFTFDVPLADVPPNWRAPKDTPTPEGSASLYALCRPSHATEVKRRVREWARGKEELKERTQLANTLRPFHEWDGDTRGWLELDNGFFFFADAEMWEKTCAVFGVKVAATADGAA